MITLIMTSLVAVGLIALAILDQQQRAAERRVRVRVRDLQRSKR